MTDACATNEDTRWLDQAWLEHKSELESFIRTRVAADEADDVLQTAALRVAEAAGSLREKERARAWLFRVVRNVVADWGRERVRRNRLFDLREDVPEIAVEFDTNIASPCTCSVALSKTLPESQAAIFQMVDVEQCMLTDAAARLAISSNNASVRLHRARATLREKLLEHCGVKSMNDCTDCSCGTTPCG